MTRLMLVLALLLTSLVTAGCTEPEVVSDPETSVTEATCGWTTQELLNLRLDSDSELSGNDAFVVPSNMTHLNFTEATGSHGFGDYKIVITDPAGASFDLHKDVQVFHYGGGSKRTISLEHPAAGEWLVDWERPPAFDFHELTVSVSACVDDTAAA